MHTIKAIYDGVNFKPMQPIPVKGNYEVFITFIEPIEQIEPIKKDGAKISQPAKLPRSTAKGILKGKVWMADDFDDPLEEMKEYME